MYAHTYSECTRLSKAVPHIRDELEREAKDPYPKRAAPEVLCDSRPHFRSMGLDPLFSSPQLCRSIRFSCLASSNALQYDCDGLGHTLHYIHSNHRCREKELVPFKPIEKGGRNKSSGWMDERQHCGPELFSER